MIADMSLLVRIPSLSSCLRCLFLGGDPHDEAPLLLLVLVTAGVLDETGRPPHHWELHELQVLMVGFVIISSAG